MALPLAEPRRRFILIAIAFGTLAVMAPCMSYARTNNAVDLFDEAIAGGLPQTIVLDDGTLTIESPLDVELHFPNEQAGDVPGSMYLVTWRGEQAVLTRSGTHVTRYMLP